MRWPACLRGGSWLSVREVGGRDGCCGGGGEDHFDPQAAFGLGGQGQGGVVGGGDGVHDGQAEAESVAVAGAVDAGSLERLQQSLEVAGRHASSGVGDGEYGVPAPHLGGHLHAAVGDVVADRVVDEVADECFEQAGVTGDRRGVDVGLNLQSRVLGVEFGGENDAVDDGAEFAGLVSFWGSVAAGKGEQRFDEAVLLLA